MTLHLLFEVRKSQKMQALKLLEPLSNGSLYQIEEPLKLFIGGFFLCIPPDLPDYLTHYSQQDMSIDWAKQWEEFCPHMNQDLLTLDLVPYGLDQKIFLKPGAGFGDLSHPTTNLCLQHIFKLCSNKAVVDFGCGSGILSVASWAFGASRVYSIEIDPDSIIHTKQNLELNHYPITYLTEYLPQLTHPLICVINMTFGEQKIALQDLKGFPQETLFLSSGILKTQILDYIKWEKTLGLEFNLLDQLGEWVIFIGNNTLKRSTSPL